MNTEIDEKKWYPSLDALTKNNMEIFLIFRECFSLFSTGPRFKNDKSYMKYMRPITQQKRKLEEKQNCHMRLVICI